MAVRKAEAQWNGTLKEGGGTMKLGSGMYEGPFTYASRFESGQGTNPEELIGAAHAGCYSMFLSALLSNAGLTPKNIQTTATVHLGTVEGAPKITHIDLVCEAEVPGIDEAAFLKQAEAAKTGCPVSKALAATEINLTAKLVS
jgi:osmotically inducible protein OsmC